MQIVGSGAITSQIILGSGASQIVSRGGSAIRTEIRGGGSQIVHGIARSAYLSRGARQTVFSGGRVIGTVISAGGRQILNYGALANGDRNSGYQTAFSGARIAGGITYGSQIVSSGARASGGTVYGMQIIRAGGWVSAAIIRGGRQNVSGMAIRTTIASGSGRQFVYKDGVASAYVVNNGGRQAVLSGGAARAGTLNAGAVQTVSAGGSVSGGRVLKGARQVVAGLAQRTTISSGGILTIMSGGSAQNAILRTGATLDMRGGASASLASASITSARFKIAGTVGLAATGIFNGANMSGASAARINIGGAQRGANIFRLGKYNNLQKITLGAANGSVEIGGIGNTVARLGANSKTNLNFDISGQKAATTSYMLRVGQKNSLAGKIKITMSARQELGTYELAANLGYAKNQTFTLMKKDGNASSAMLTLKANGQERKSCGICYKLTNTANNLKLTIAAVKGQIKLGKGQSGDIRGTANCDIFYGGAGNQIIRGAGGRDVAVYDAGNWGRDRIVADNMTILVSDVSSSQVTRAFEGGNMVIRRKGTGQSITIQNWNADSHKIVFGGTLGQFSRYAAQARPTVAQKNAAFNEVWKKTGLLA